MIKLKEPLRKPLKIETPISPDETKTLVKHGPVCLLNLANLLKQSTEKYFTNLDCFLCILFPFVLGANITDPDKYKHCFVYIHHVSILH